MNQRRYFFCKRNWDYNWKTCRSRINNISDESGYWKQVGKEKAISVVDVALNTSSVVATKKSFVLYQGKHPRGSKTSWFLHEYRLLPSQISTTTTTTMVCIYNTFETLFINLFIQTLIKIYNFYGVGFGELGCISRKSEEKKLESEKYEEEEDDCWRIWWCDGADEHG